MTLSEADIREYVQTTVQRPRRREQGDRVYGVCTIRPETNSSSNKLYDDRDDAERRLREMPDSPLYKPEMHAVVFYTGTISSAGPADMRNTMVVDPTEEELVTLTDLALIESWPVGDEVDFD